MRNFVVAFCTLSVLFVSCKKQKEKEPEKTRRELITNTWRVTDVKLGGTSVLALAEQLRCVTDNILTLHPDGNFSLDEGDHICSPPLEGSGKWDLENNDTTIKVDFTEGENEQVLIPILELTATVLRITYHIQEAPIPGNYELVLQRQ